MSGTMPCAAPCSMRPIPDAEPTSPCKSGSEPPASPKKRKLRKFAIRRRCRLPPLPQDAWDTLLRHLEDRPLSLLLCMMTCKELRGLLVEHHQTWRSVYSRWEGRWASHNPRSMHRVRPVPNSLGYMRMGLRPGGKPVSGQPCVTNFSDAPIAEADRPRFHAFTRKLVAMQFLDRCSMCGTRRRTSRPYWSLGLCLCKPCLRANLISHRVLALRYNLGLTDLYRGTRVTQLVRRRVFYFRSIMPPTDRMDYSLDPIDFECRGSEEIYFFWLPHLERVLDLPQLWRQRLARLTAAGKLTAAVRARQVRAVHAYFDGKPRLDAAARLKRLFRNEINRVEQSRTPPRVYVDAIFRHVNRDAQDRFCEFADSLPEPWDTQLDPAPDAPADAGAFDPLVDH